MAKRLAHATWHRRGSSTLTSLRLDSSICKPLRLAKHELLKTLHLSQTAIADLGSLQKTQTANETYVHYVKQSLYCFGNAQLDCTLHTNQYRILRLLLVKSLWQVLFIYIRHAVSYNKHLSHLRRGLQTTGVKATYLVMLLDLDVET